MLDLCYVYKLDSNPNPEWQTPGMVGRCRDGTSKFV